MALTDMSGDTIAALPDDHLENAVANAITDALEGAGFVPSGQSWGGDRLGQKYQRGTRSVMVIVEVMT